MKRILFAVSLAFLGLLACKQDNTTTNENAQERTRENAPRDLSKTKTGERKEAEDYTATDLMAKSGRGNVLHVPPPKEKVNRENAFKIIYEGLFADSNKIGKSSSMSLFTFNPTGTQALEFNADEIIGLANALKDNPNVKIQIQSHSNLALGITHSRANAVKQLLIENGAPADQVSSMGKGKESAAKAAGNIISVKLLQQ